MIGITMRAKVQENGVRGDMVFLRNLEVNKEFAGEVIDEEPCSSDILRLEREERNDMFYRILSTGLALYMTSAVGAESLWRSESES